MTDRIVTIATAALVMAVAAAPAFAGAGAPRLPEPSAMGLFGLGIGGAYLARRLIRRK
jgi:PEP-CTERM motif